jgi:glucose-6-phosphate 1-epimerase
VSWKPLSASGAPGLERLFLSSMSALDGSRAIRGGVPVIFPQFAERGSGMRHGFARTANWRVLDSGVQDGAAFAVLGWTRPTCRPGTPRLAARLRTALRVAMRGAELSMTLDVRNTGAACPSRSRRRCIPTTWSTTSEAVRIDGVQAETLAITDKLDQVFEARIAGRHRLR